MKIFNIINKKFIDKILIHNKDGGHVSIRAFSLEISFMEVCLGESFIKYFFIIK